VPFDSRLQVGTFAGFLAAVAFNVSGTRLAHGATVCALGYWSTLLIYMLKRAVYRARDISKCSHINEAQGQRGGMGEGPGVGRR
jgi:hypothetical protein